MNEWGRLEQQAKRIKEEYPSGTRILLTKMDDPFAPVPPGTRGTVEYVDSIGQIHMKWDNHRTLAVVPAVDTFRKLTPEEIEAEQTSQGRVDDLISQASNLERKQSDGMTQKQANQTLNNNVNPGNER